MSPEHARQLLFRFLFVKFERLAQEEGLSFDGGRIRPRLTQVGQIVEMEDAGNRVLVKRSLGLSIRESLGGAVLETSGAETFPHVDCRILA